MQGQNHSKPTNENRWLMPTWMGKCSGWRTRGICLLPFFTCCFSSLSAPTWPTWTWLLTPFALSSAAHAQPHWFYICSLAVSQLTSSGLATAGDNLDWRHSIKLVVWVLEKLEGCPSKPAQGTEASTWVLSRTRQIPRPRPYDPFPSTRSHMLNFHHLPIMLLSCGLISGWIHW